MSNQEKYDAIFMNSILVTKDQLNSSLKYESVPTWDSIGHMSLIAALESEFSINFNIDDVIDFSSYFHGIEILKKYNIVV